MRSIATTATPPTTAAARTGALVGVELISLPDGDEARAQLERALEPLYVPAPDVLESFSFSPSRPTRLFDIPQNDLPVVRARLHAFGVMTRSTLTRSAQVSLVLAGMILGTVCAIFVVKGLGVIFALGMFVGLALIIIAEALGGPGEKTMFVVRSGASLEHEPAPRWEIEAKHMAGEGESDVSPKSDLELLARLVRDRRGTQWEMERRELHDTLIDRILELRADTMSTIDNLDRVEDAITQLPASTKFHRGRTSLEADRCALRETLSAIDAVLRDAIALAVGPTTTT